MLQWQGTTSGGIVESGVGWANLNIAFSSVNPNVYYIAMMRAVVDAGRLAGFAKSTAEVAFFQRNNVITLFVPKYLPETSGYNKANLLTGM